MALTDEGGTPLVITTEAGQPKVMKGISPTQASRNQMFQSQLFQGKFLAAVDTASAIGFIKTTLAAATNAAAHIMIAHREYAPNKGKEHTAIEKFRLLTRLIEDSHHLTPFECDLEPSEKG